MFVSPLFVCLYVRQSPVCLPVCTSVTCLSASMFVILLFVCLYVRQSPVCLPVCTSVTCLSACMFVSPQFLCLYVRQSRVCLYVRQSRVCVYVRHSPVCLPVCTSVTCLSACMFVSPLFSCMFVSPLFSCMFDSPLSVCMYVRQCPVCSSVSVRQSLSSCATCIYSITPPLFFRLYVCSPVCTTRLHSCRAVVFVLVFVCMSVRQSFSTYAKCFYICSVTPVFIWLFGWFVCLFATCLYSCMDIPVCSSVCLFASHYSRVRKASTDVRTPLCCCFVGMYVYSCKSTPVVVVLSVCLFASRLPTFTTCLNLCCKVSLSSHRTQGEASQKSTDSQASWGDNRSYRGVHKMAR